MADVNRDASVLGRARLFLVDIDITEMVANIQDEGRAAQEMAAQEAAAREAFESCDARWTLSLQAYLGQLGTVEQADSLSVQLRHPERVLRPDWPVRQESRLPAD